MYLMYLVSTDKKDVGSHPNAHLLGSGLPRRGNASLRASPEEKRSLPEAPAALHGEFAHETNVESPRTIAT